MQEAPLKNETFQKESNFESSLPSVTIVTVVYNDEKNIEKTLRSVIKQKYPKIEYIVIDGGSTDGTIDIIKKYEKKIDYWISEEDKGVYDAMNKGIDLASGEWINFMNSNDLFYNSTTIYDVFKETPRDVDFIYGYFIRRGEGKDEYVGMYRPLDELWKGMSFCHQTLFAKTQLMKKNKFSLNNKVISDYQSIFLNYISGKKFYNTKKIIAIIAPLGISGKPLPRVFERWRLVRKHLGYKVDFYFISLVPASLVQYYISPRLNDFIIKKVSSTKLAKAILKQSTTSLMKKE